MTCLKANTCDIAMKLTTADREDRNAVLTAQEGSALSIVEELGGPMY
jgi:hypothetical protein